MRLVISYGHQISSGVSAGNLTGTHHERGANIQIPSTTRSKLSSKCSRRTGNSTGSRTGNCEIVNAHGVCSAVAQGHSAVSWKRNVVGEITFAGHIKAGGAVESFLSARCQCASRVCPDVGCCNDDRTGSSHNIAEFKSSALRNGDRIDDGGIRRPHCRRSGLRHRPASHYQRTDSQCQFAHLRVHFKPFVKNNRGKIAHPSRCLPLLHRGLALRIRFYFRPTSGTENQIFPLPAHAAAGGKTYQITIFVTSCLDCDEFVKYFRFSLKKNS